MRKCFNIFTIVGLCDKIPTYHQNRIVSVIDVMLCLARGFERIGSLRKIKWGGVLYAVYRLF